MSSADWSVLSGSLSSPDIAKGVTSGPVKPNGGGTFVYGINTLTNTPGAVGLYASPQAPNTNFNPLVKGGVISMAVQRGLGGGLTDWSTFLFIGLNGTAVTNTAYLLGLSDGDPCHIELRKGVLATGLPDEAPGGANGILRRSTSVVPVGEWVHLKLEMVYNTNGDVILNCYQSDLDAHAVSTPTWVAIAGMDPFTDDALGINSGSLPYTSGRVGFGGQFADITRVALFDHAIVEKQT